MSNPLQSVRILGINFFNGNLEDALEIAQNEGGLFLAPSGPNLADLGTLPSYDEALKAATINLVDSGCLALLWKQRTGERLQRHSGLKFLKALIDERTFKENPRQLWVLPNEEHVAATQAYLQKQKIALAPKHFYEAPHYSIDHIEDTHLFDRIREQRPDFVIIAIAGGKQEVLGNWLYQRLDYEPTILCIGAAIAFLNGKQANIPLWADRLFLGWFFRILHRPAIFIPRYWRARRLRRLLQEWGTEAPA